MYLYFMEITIERPPRTMMEVYEMLPEGTLAELIDNQIYMSPAPNFLHQKTVKSIVNELDKVVEDTGTGTVIFAPYDVKLDITKNVVQPDVVVILKTNPHQIDERGGYQGAPDLLVEVIPPGNKDYDLITKKNLYEKFGVKEYWIVDPETKLAIGFNLSGNSYIKISEEIGKIQSPLLNSEFKF
jgi:Uma2 family endonuclease